jgi:hypothetical protein
MQERRDVLRYAAPQPILHCDLARLDASLNSVGMRRQTSSRAWIGRVTERAAWGWKGQVL